MKQILFILISLCSFSKALAQIDTLKLNAFNIELLGPCGGGSVNYERLIKLNTKSYLDLSFGGMYSPAKSYVVPQINLLFGNRHFFEMGFAITQGVDQDHRKDRTNSLRIGYRFQKLKQGGFMFRAGFTPFLNLKVLGKERFFPWAGVTFGYSF